MRIEYALPPMSAAFAARKMAEMAALRQQRFALLGQVMEIERASDEAQRTIEAHLNVVRETAELPAANYVLSDDFTKLVADVPVADPPPAPTAPDPEKENTDGLAG